MRDPLKQTLPYKGIGVEAEKLAQFKGSTLTPLDYFSI